MNSKILKILSLLLTVVMISSCMVSKKKYTALQNESIRKQDSLSKVITNYQTDFNNFMTNSKANDSYKLNTIDSLFKANSKLSSDTLNLQQTLRNAITEYETQKNKLVQLTNDMEEKNNEIENLNVSLQNKEQELKNLQEMVDKTKKQNEILLNTVQKALVAFDSSELSVYEKDGKIYVSLEEKLLFKSGSAKIDPKGEDAIIKIAKVLENNPDISVIIEGHTDNVGESDYNWNLSTQRSLAVVKIIEKNSKVDMSRITVAGRGMYAPIADNLTDAGRRKNRRIEIILQPKLDVLYKLLQN